MKTLRDLLTALLNATLLLVLAVLVSAIILVGRVAALRDDTVAIVRHAVGPQIERLDEIAAGIQSLERHLSAESTQDGARLRAAIAELKAELPPLQDFECVARQTIVTQLVERIGEALRGREGVDG